MLKTIAVLFIYYLTLFKYQFLKKIQKCLASFKNYIFDL